VKLLKNAWFFLIVNLDEIADIIKFIFIQEQNIMRSDGRIEGFS
jgi:hypothetical protein